ncbi:hypothetical protein EXE43_06790 [Halorubrum sp. SS5]|nr:hypothetical protein EXE43_06790 [Halorubrum sp. SS5]
MSDIPAELATHDGPRCSYACWSTEPSIVSNGTAYDCKPNSRWARETFKVTIVANTILGCNCDDDGLCKHIEHVIESDWRGCIEYHPIDDQKRVEELKRFTRGRRRVLYEKFFATE